MIKKSILALLIITILGTLVYGGWYYFFGQKRQKVSVLTLPVARGTFFHEIVGKGSAESAKNVDIICQVEGQSTIVELIHEGESVEEGAILVRLDTQDIDDKVNSQQIKYNSSLATVASSQASLRTAELSLEEYIEGTFEQEWLKIDNSIFSYRETQKQNADSVRYSERLLQLGYSTTAQLEIDRVTEQKAINDVKSSLLEQLVLLKYTSEKKITELMSSIETARANLDSNTYTNKLDKDRLDHYKEQQLLCSIRAPQAGQVVYANQDSRPGRSESEIIKDGATVRKGQVLIRLPDPNQMQVKAMINEANISYVKPGMKVILGFDAITNKQYHGEVVKVNRYPEIVWMSSAKDYVTLIRINDNARDIRTGLTAEVRIVAQQIENALLIPVHCVVEVGRKTYCLTCQEGIWNYREVLLGASNDKEVIILKGLEENELVVAGARQYKSKVTFPSETAPSIFAEKVNTKETSPETDKSTDTKAESAPQPPKKESDQIAIPEGMRGKRPDRGEMPEGMRGKRPDRGEMPEGMMGKRPDRGEMPEGMMGKRPDRGEMPEGMMAGGAPGSFQGMPPENGMNPFGNSTRKNRSASGKNSSHSEKSNAKSGENKEVKADHLQLLRIEPIKKYFDLTAMEFCRKLDVNKDKIITRAEIKTVAPELIQFFGDWDRNKDGHWSQTDFVLGFCTARNLYQKSERLFSSDGSAPSGHSSSNKSRFQEWLESDPKEKFQELDLNKDGVITPREYPIAQYDLFESIMGRFDQNKNEAVDWSEFESGFMAMETNLRQNAAKKNSPKVKTKETSNAKITAPPKQKDSASGKLQSTQAKVLKSKGLLNSKSKVIATETKE